MHQINEVANHGGLRRFDTYSRLWEYPWVWTRLEPFKGRNLRVLDIGTWVESDWKDNVRILMGEFSTFYSVSRWHLRYYLSAIRNNVTKFVKSARSE